jgi:hypothetical protein
MIYYEMLKVVYSIKATKFLTPTISLEPEVNLSLQASRLSPREFFWNTLGSTSTNESISRILID